MRGWLLDTNVISKLCRPKPAAAVAEFVTAQPGELLFTTEVTFGEIRFGIEQLEDADRQITNERFGRAWPLLPYCNSTH